MLASAFGCTCSFSVHSVDAHTGQVRIWGPVGSVLTATILNQTELPRKCKYSENITGLGEIWGSHSGEYEDGCLLGYCARVMSTDDRGSKHLWTLVNFYQTTWCSNLEDSHLHYRTCLQNQNKIWLKLKSHSHLNPDMHFLKTWRWITTVLRLLKFI
jgi:hypothetical protein